MVIVLAADASKWTDEIFLEDLVLKCLWFLAAWCNESSNLCHVLADVLERKTGQNGIFLTLQTHLFEVALSELFI